jgi:methyl-accepting chemotaxis protein
LIEGTVKKIDEGPGIVRKTGEQFSKVATSSTRMAEVVDEITSASHEQAQGIEQINRAVSEMDKVVQQNASHSEEFAAASEEMSAQATQMQGSIEYLMAMVGGSDKDRGPANSSEKK